MALGHSIQWDSFKEWVYSQYSKAHASEVVNKATKYHMALFSAKSAAELKALSSDKKRHTMIALSALSKYLGIYEEWKSIQEQAGLKWEKPSGASIVKALLSQEGNDAFAWLKEIALRKLPNEYRLSMVFIALTGLRPAEACESMRLISQLSKNGKLGEYFDSELCMLQHYKYPDMFLRNTKNCYVSFLNKDIIRKVGNSRAFSYCAVETALARYDCLPRQTYGLRKFYGTTLKKTLDREMIDLLQGRLDASVFVKHYYRPVLIELRDKVLGSVKSLEDELLNLGEV